MHDTKPKLVERLKGVDTRDVENMLAAFRETKALFEEIILLNAAHARSICAVAVLAQKNPRQGAGKKVLIPS